jgi:transcriptional regulator with GAF, ATPase, and Fis domain
MATRLETLTKQYKREKDRQKRDLVRFQITGEVSRLLASTMDRYSDCLGEIVQTVAVIMDAERVSLMVRKKNFLEIAASVGIPQETLDKGVFIRLGQGIAGKVAQTGEPVMTGDLRRDKDLKKDAVGGAQYKSNAFICLPLKVDGSEEAPGEVVGVINVSNPQHGTTFDSRDSNFLTKVADLMGTFLHKSMQFEAMRVKTGMKGRVSVTGLPALDLKKIQTARETEALKKRLEPRPKRMPFKSRPPAQRQSEPLQEKPKPKPPPLPPGAKKK